MKSVILIYSSLLREIIISSPVIPTVAEESLLFVCSINLAFGKGSLYTGRDDRRKEDKVKKSF